MKITIELTEENLKSNIVLQAVKQMLQANQTINIDSQKKENKAITEVKTPQVDIDDCDFVEDVTKPKKKVKTKEERVTELKNYANSIWKDLSDAKKKSLKSFVTFYEKKINEENFNINIATQWQKWWQNDKNNK